MKDITVRLPDRPGALATLGEALGRRGVSVEGGGAFRVPGTGAGLAHFLVEAADEAQEALEAVGLEVVEVRPVLVQRLDQERPGQLGAICRRMAEAGVNIEVLYSDHDHRLILVVDDPERGQVVSDGWESERLSRRR
ncbi:MAG: amino acid-binding protein [Myxococcales bacterium]|nr:amino acid-binding protein [Myxococcales bacterium]MCB9648827.1 amino acid-binding ACT domain-containing protein [Deltaproteobacteria bacterium]